MRQLSEGDSPQSPDAGGGDNGGEMETPWDGRVPLWCLRFLQKQSRSFRLIPLDLSHVFTREGSYGKGQWREC